MIAVLRVPVYMCFGSILSVKSSCVAFIDVGKLPWLGVKDTTKCCVACTCLYVFWVLVCGMFVSGFYPCVCDVAQAQHA